MKKYINTTRGFAKGLVLLSVLIALMMPRLLLADVNQETKKVKYRMNLAYHKFTNGDKSLTARLYYREGTKFINVSNVLVGFFLITEEDEILLAEVETKEDGYAILQIAAGYQLPWDSDNYCTFIARFDGNEEGKPTDEEIMIKNINIDFDFIMEDGEKYVNVNITEAGDSGEIIPVYDAEVYGYIERMFSLLPIGEDYSDEDGKLTFEFPKDLPGDSLGNLVVVVRINESDDYGTVEMIKTIDWGIPVDFSESKTPRTLWTDEAPVWMALAVFIILAGAWFNFALALYKVIKLKRLGKQTHTQESLPE